LSEEEQQLLNARDWRGLIQYGASFFLLEKMGAVVGVSNLHIYAAMRGLSEEEQQLLNARDWRGLIQYGASFFLLEKMGAV
ncbi:hypothetical protein C5706_32780, partial [Klebsiella pneumoniae]